MYTSAFDIQTAFAYTKYWRVHTCLKFHEYMFKAFSKLYAETLIDDR